MAEKPVEPGPKVVSPCGLAHVVFRTNQYERMYKFWQTFLGARIPFQSDDMCFLTYDEEHHRVLIARLPGTTDHVEDAAGMQHVSFTFRNLDDLALAYQQRKEHSVRPFWCVNHGGTTSMYYKDPDGNNIETQVDNFDTAEEANEFLATDAFRKNPIGIDFDPEEFVRRVREGESHQSIKLGAYGMGLGPGQRKLFFSWI